MRSILDSARDLAERIVLELEGDPGNDFLTVYLEGLDRQPRGVQEMALRLADEGTRFRSRSIPVRVVAQLASDPRTTNRFATPFLAARFSTLVLPVLPMEGRRDELLKIVTELAADLVLRLGLGSRWLSPEAARNLADREWPGDFEELEAGLARILTAAPGTVVTLENVLAAEDATAARLAEPTARAAAASPARAADPPLEGLLMELAHELKNPMVTLKTFSEHLDRLLDDPEMRSKFVGLAGEAIDRMDGFLEDLLAFSRFGEPRPRAVPLEALLTRALGGAGAVRDRFSGNGIPAGVVVVADEEQVEFAIRALLRGLSKQLSPGAPIVYQWVAPGELRFDSRAEAAGIARHNIMGQGVRDELFASLDLFVCRSLIERNRGRLLAERDDAGLHVRLELPVGGAR